MSIGKLQSIKFTWKQNDLIDLSDIGKKVKGLEYTVVTNNGASVYMPSQSASGKKFHP